MQEKDELLFILSSTDRRGMLSALQEKDLRLTQLAPKLSMTVQESSRQLARLQKARLIERGSNGLFSLTSLGKIVLRQLPTFDFLAQRSDFLASHDLSKLPPEFVERIGELANHEYGETLGEILTHFAEVLKGAREYVWLMADHSLLEEPIARHAFNSQVKMRIVVPEAVTKASGYPSFLNGTPGERIEVRLAKTSAVGMAINESIAGVTFSDQAGRVDFGRGLKGSDPDFHRWCGDLFLYEWDRAKRLN